MTSKGQLFKYGCHFSSYLSDTSYGLQIEMETESCNKFHVMIGVQIYYCQFTSWTSHISDKPSPRAEEKLHKLVYVSRFAQINRCLCAQCYMCLCLHLRLSANWLAQMANYLLTLYIKHYLPCDDVRYQ